MLSHALSYERIYKIILSLPSTDLFSGWFETGACHHEHASPEVSPFFVVEPERKAVATFVTHFTLVITDIVEAKWSHLPTE